jgi:hypothetical protein
MKSRLLAKQLQEIFGGEGEPQFRQLIEQARAASNMVWRTVLKRSVSSIRRIVLMPASISAPGIQSFRAMR